MVVTVRRYCPADGCSIHEGSWGQRSKLFLSLKKKKKGEERMSSWQQEVAHLTREQRSQTRACPTSVMKTGSYLNAVHLTLFAKVMVSAAVAVFLLLTSLT